MLRTIVPISALLLGSFLLLFAGGMNSLILPVRGTAEGFSTFSLGLLGTGWAVGFVSGCYFTARIVQRAGHIRAFSVMASFASISILAQLLLMDPWAWVPLRAIAGFAFAGAAMIVESWLSERAEPSTRGRIFGIYTMVNLAGSTAGQLSLTLGDATGFLFFVLPAMLYALALIPTALTSTTTPKPLVSVSLDLPKLWRTSPIAVVGVVMLGMANSAFGTLAAVYASAIGLTVAVIAVFTSLPILLGAAAQIPVGYASDKFDRRAVLIAVACVALIADLAFVFVAPQTQTLNLAFVAVFGAAIFAMYPVIIAHANDNATDGNYIQVSGGLLFLFGSGSVIGPILGGLAMGQFGPEGLFIVAAIAHLLMIAYAGWRMTRRPSVSREAKVDFVPVPGVRSTTPETIAMGAPEDPQADPDPDQPR